MRWLEQSIRRYEHRRWTVDDNRRVLPFSWGLEYIGGRADDPAPREFLDPWVDHTLAHSEEWFATAPAHDYRYCIRRKTRRTADACSPSRAPYNRAGRE